MFLVNSRLSTFAAASIARGRPYPEVTAAVLPSSLTKVLSYTLGFSPHLPVSVCGTDTLNFKLLEIFLGSFSLIIGLDRNRDLFVLKQLNVFRICLKNTVFG